MLRLVIYELFQAAIKSPSHIKGKSFISLCHDIVKSDKTSVDFLISDIPKGITKSQTNQFLNLVQDNIILISQGIGPSRSLSSEYYKAHKLLFIAEILNTLLLKRAALFVAAKAIKTSTKYQFLNISFQAYRIMYTVKRWMNDEAGEIQASINFKKYLKYYELEKNIEIDYYTLLRQYTINKGRNSDVNSICIKLENLYQDYENNIPSFYFHYFYYNILYIKLSNENRHSEVYDISKKAFTFFDNLKFNFISGKLVFIIIQIIYCIQKREFDTGQLLIERAKSFITINSPYWYYISEYEFLLNFHRGDYNEGVVTFYRAINNKAFVLVTPQIKERWILYEAYVNLVLETGNATYQNRKKRFSIQKFINELPQYSKDKRAMNIPVLIAQMLFFIVRRQYNKAIDRIEALEKYSSRYLRNDETFRSSCFIKMILQIPKCSFNRLQVERNAQKYYKRLLESEIDLIDQPFEIEIIPYERLWAMIMDHLRPDHHYTPKGSRMR